jgi:hypothetical protein
MAAAANGLVASTTWACAVCQGNRDSDLVKGAEAGVLTMVLITYGVLMLFGAMIVACFVRSRRRMRGAASSQKINSL